MHRGRSLRYDFDELDDRTSYKILFSLMSIVWIVAIVLNDPVVMALGWFMAIPATILLAVLRHFWHRRFSAYDSPNTRRT
jgi:hypothetical protein